MNTIIKYLFLVTVLLVPYSIFGQGNGSSCDSAAPFCTGTTYNFPAGVNSPAAPATGVPGPNYGCLYSQPNPVWYYMQVGTSGNIEIHIQGSLQHDVDFCCWGPFNSTPLPCYSGLTAGSGAVTHHAPGPSANYPSLNMVDCSYDASWEEWCYIPNAVVGQVYLLLITNYSNQPQNIVFSQSNVGTAQAGGADCGILSNCHNNGPLCEGDTLKLTANTLSNAQYYWSGPNNWTSMQQNPMIIHATVANAGVYNLQIVSGSQVSPEAHTTVVVNPKPVVTATSDTICIGDQATITASSTVANTTYSWSPIVSTASTLTLSPTITTNYTVIGTAAGCKDTATTSIIVNNLPLITVNDATICQGFSAQLTATNGVTYLWSDSTTTNPRTVSPTQTTMYYVVGRDANGCINMDSALVTVNYSPIVNVDPASACNGGMITLTATGADTYVWNTGDTASTVVLYPSSTTVFSVTGTNTNGCVGTDTALVTIYPVPVASFEPNPPVASTDDPNIHFDNNSTFASFYSWNFGDPSSFGNTSNDASPSHTYSSYGDFPVWLYVESQAGCKDSTSKHVIIENPYFFFVPNAFSPNGEGTNEEFLVSGIGVDLSYFEMTIYDRWGELVFKTDNMYEGWNGKKFNAGSTLLPGIYIYNIYLRQLGGIKKHYSGHVTLIR